LAAGGRACFYGSTRQEALAKLEEASWMIASQLPVTTRTLTLAEYLASWTDVTRSRVRPSTRDTYEINVRRLVAQLGPVPITRLNPPRTQGAYLALLEDGLSDYSVLQAHRMLHRALGQALHCGLVSRNPAAMALPPRPRKRTMTALTTDQLNLLFAQTRSDRLHALWFVLGTAGLRLGEALGLAWDDVDLGTGRLVVRRALQHQKGAGFVFVLPKTATSRRTVVLTRRAVEALRSHRHLEHERRLRTTDWHDSGLGFTNTYGGPLQQSRPAVGLQRALRETGLPKIRVHDLRHTAASALLQAGVHPKVVQDMLGHSSITTTMDTYATSCRPSMTTPSAAWTRSSRTGDTVLR
jgi:integrase